MRWFSWGHQFWRTSLGGNGDDMKIAMLARNPDLYSHRRLKQAAEERGHELTTLDTLQFVIDIAPDGPHLRHQGEALEGYDAVIPRIGTSVTYYGLAVLRQFEMLGVYPLNESVAIDRSRNKLRTLQLLSRAGIGLPRTAIAHKPEKAEEVIERVGGPPVVVKLLEGTQGLGVMIAETHRSAKSTVEAFRAERVNIMVQEFIEEAGNSDLRILVVGEEIVAAMERSGGKDDFRSNVHRGGAARSAELSEAERTTALRAAHTLGLSVCGVDMLRARSGPVVMEVNSSPGLEGIEAATGVDIAAKIIEFLETHAKRGATRESPAI